jgi:hypothetical protein
MRHNMAPAVKRGGGCAPVLARRVKGLRAGLNVGLLWRVAGGAVSRIRAFTPSGELL